METKLTNATASENEDNVDMVVTEHVVKNKCEDDLVVQDADEVLEVIVDGKGNLEQCRQSHL